MATRSELWELVDPLVVEAGLELYDLEAPTSDSGVLRVFIAKAGGESAGGVTLDDCAGVSRRIGAKLEERGLYSENLSLEVSSPGINRKLSRPEHFARAVGERIRIKAGGQSAQDAPGNAGRNISLTGRLSSFDGRSLVVEDEEQHRAVTVQLEDVRQARVDFKFGGGKPGKGS